MDIKKRIKEAGMTVSEVAALMPNRNGSKGIAQASLSAIINGNPTIGSLKDISAIIGISLSELVSEDDCNRDFVAMVRCNGKYYHAESLEELEAMVQKWKQSDISESRG